MRATRPLVFLALALAAGCTRLNPAYVGGPRGDGAPADAGRLDQASADAPGLDLPAADAPPDVFVPPAGCGTGVADIGGISGADGLVIDTDGTIYFLTDDASNSYLGRIRPGQAPETRWQQVQDSPTTWGLALDSPRKRLYVLVVDGPGALVAFDNVTTAPAGRIFFSGINNGNDVVVAADGTVYFTQQGDRHIYSLAPAGGSATRVTSTAIGTPNLQQAPAGLALASDSSLLVGLEHGGPIYKITLAGGLESARSPVGAWMGWANGLTFDRRDRLYISIYDDTTPQAVARLEANGSVTPLATGGRYSSLAFGRGALDCRDLYVAEPFGPMRRIRVPDAL